MVEVWRVLFGDMKYVFQIFRYKPPLCIAIFQAALLSASLSSCNANENKFMQVELGVESFKEMRVHPKPNRDYILRLSLVDGNANSIYEPNFSLKGTLIISDKTGNTLYSTKIPTNYSYTFNSLPLVQLPAKTNLNTRADRVTVKGVEMSSDVDPVDSQPRLLVRFQRHYDSID